MPGKYVRKDCPLCGTSHVNPKYCSVVCSSTFRQQEKDKLGSTVFSQGQALRNYLIRTRGHMCQICFNHEWMGKYTPLEVDHISGDWRDGREENLRLLCPNCHAQTDTYKNKNNGNGRPNRRATVTQLVE